MSSSEVKVFKISNQTSQYLVEKGFSICKSCGKDVRGLKLALGLGYIENLALRINFEYTNFQFLLPCLETLVSRTHLSDLLQLIQSIIDGKTNHEELVNAAKTSIDLQDNIIEFSEFVFNISSELQSIDEILNWPEFERALSELNIQLLVYSNEKSYLEKKINFFVHPIVIPILIIEHSSVYNLYHENYKEIEHEHLNTSLQVGLVGKCPSLVNELETVLSLIINNSSHPEVSNIVEPLKKVSPSLFNN